MWDFIEKNWLAFHAWMKPLSNAEAGLFIFILGLVVSLLVWSFKRITRKPQTQLPETYTQLTDSGANISQPQTKVEVTQHHHHYAPSAAAEPRDTITTKPKKTAIAVDRLPNVPGEFFGRAQELALLKDATQPEAKTRIVQFIAAGGTGKTKLLRHWLNENEATFPNRIIWSFYSQGTTEAKQISLTPLFDEAFKAFGID